MQNIYFSLFEQLRSLEGTELWLLIGAAIVAVALIVFLVLFTRHRAKKKKQEAAEAAAVANVQKRRASLTQMIVYGALCLAVSFVLSYIKLFSMPFGGSITLVSMLPIAFYAHRMGIGPGLLCGLAAGLLQFIQAPYFLNVAQFLLDYLAGFACIGLAGLFKKNLPLGTFVGGFGRFACSFIAGVTFYAEYAGDFGLSPAVYSLFYNGSTLLVDTLLCVIVALLPPVQRLFKRLIPGR